ncbi:substrate-binding domain-containing protein [Microbispora sp. RL4-1S]|uniref:Substrate-binding domain-containing protein n=1 Tax=Microbispora oryzae TaxID=2806554 RepID=A0A940WBU7_9ACTN|nr:substrate-binding domain-containing protein [Microbispora oryzae]MBP2702605.1 substrate-binding domain-containing protein [Microbispora oryzae]
MGRRLASWCAGLVFLAVLPGCAGPRENPDTGLAAVGTVRDGFRIGLLLPERERYDREDRPAVVRAISSICRRCQVVYRNAEGDPARQERQVAALLADGVRVLILGPVRPSGTASTVARAKLLGAKVVAYDRLANGPIDGYVSSDPAAMGALLGRALLDAVRARRVASAGPVVLLKGPPGDPYAAALATGVRSVLDGRLTIGWEGDVADGGPRGAREETERALSALGGPGGVAGVCCTNDVMAGGAADALVAAGAKGTPLVGVGAGPGAVLRIGDGRQTAAVRMPVAAEAAAAARMAVDIAVGRSGMPGAGTGTEAGARTARVDNGTTVGIPAVLIPPVLLRAGVHGAG